MEVQHIRILDVPLEKVFFEELGVLNYRKKVTFTSFLIENSNTYCWRLLQYRDILR